MLNCTKSHVETRQVMVGLKDGSNQVFVFIVSSQLLWMTFYLCWFDTQKFHMDRRQKITDKLYLLVAKIFSPIVSALF
jgi:hypothetical protein